MEALPYRPSDSPFSSRLTSMLIPQTDVQGRTIPSLIPQEHATCFFVAGDNVKRECGNDPNCRLVGLEAVEGVGLGFGRFYSNIGDEQRFFEALNTRPLSNSGLTRIAYKTALTKCQKAREVTQSNISRFRGTQEEFIAYQREQERLKKNSEASATLCESVANTIVRNLWKCNYVSTIHSDRGGERSNPTKKTGRTNRNKVSKGEAEVNSRLEKVLKS